MKVLLATEGNTLESKIAKRFGEAPYYLIYDTETNEVEPTVNHGHDDNHSGLIKLVEEGVLHYIVGNTGPNAFNVLDERNSVLYLARGMVAKEALDAFLSQKLEQLTKATLKRPIRRDSQ
ncbi:MAG: NifB/NifX family molybdenum-iron cluster-binding protein [Bacteroidales bacterium]|nr:NifB/NifX family molybdenum-iron cluster-binding protein [Bacteroidales bacterium]